MAVHFDRSASGTNVTLISAYMPRLQALFFAAGWDIIYADSDAIGGGSSGVPAWDKTPATNVSAGRAIYRMPANGHSRQWYVQLEPFWGSNVTLTGMTIKLGTGESAGTLTGAGNALTWGPASASNISQEFMACASEDGFALGVGLSNVNTNMWILVERLRDLDGTVLDDLGVLGSSNGGSWPDGATGSYGCIRYRASDALQFAANRTFLLTPIASFQSASSWGTGATTTAADGETNVLIGPFNASGGMAGLPRLLLACMVDDSVANTDHPVFIDGSVKLYRTPTVAPPAGGPRLLFAQE